MEQETKFYQNTLRILLILYFFSEEYASPSNKEAVRLFTNEIRLQKINFLIRYPSYLCYELILDIEKYPTKTQNIQRTVSQIFRDKEPQIRTEEMERFLYGAWEALDEVILFLKTYNFIKFDSKVRKDMQQHQKKYYLTKFAVDKIENGLKKIPSLNWYFDRCLLIKEYFGDLSGKELRIRQYQHPEYSATALGKKIADIEQKTKELFYKKFNEKL